MIFFNRNIALELADCIIRLDYWLSKNEKCIGCVKGSGKKFKRDEYNFQEGKLYAYAYTLMRLGYAKFWHPISSEPSYVPILAHAWKLSTDELVQVFIKKDLFDEALNLNAPQLKRDIIKHRKKREKIKSRNK